MATVDLLSKGDTQKGCEKVTTTSVMDVLKWHTGDYRVLVQDAEPMVVPWTDSCDKFWTCVFSSASYIMTHDKYDQIRN